MPANKQAAEQFAREWAGRGDENQDTQLYWIGLLQDVLGLEDALRRVKFEVPTLTDAESAHQGYVDVLIPSAQVLVEQKSLGVDLDKPETRQGRQVTPIQQALGYQAGMPFGDKPRYLMTCNFERLRLYDTAADPKCIHPPKWELTLEDLPRNVAALQFLDGGHDAADSLQQAVSIKAGEVMGRIHDLVAARFIDPDAPESHHALSVFCTRVMFLMFCEDAGVIEADVFADYIRHNDAKHLRRALLDLFAWLDTPDAERDPYADDDLKRFPYMDGGMFREQCELPQLDETIRTTILVDGCENFDWSNVNPTVFGSIFEGALSHDMRRAGGMHYTSPENIHRVIDPLFLDGLQAELDEALARPVAGGARRKALDDFHDRIAGLTFLDPACGSGNFLTQTYVSLRRLENRVLLEQAKDGQTSFAMEEVEESPVRVSLAHFHGIEVNDYACAVARTALWIAEKQADADTAKVIKRVYDPLPLTDYRNIAQGNALQMDWDDVVPADQCDYVMGNPPFIGYSNLTDEQKKDRADIFGKTGGVLDYVTCWYKKAADYTRGTHARCAFVSTNSICQGQQVEPLWHPLAADGVHIDFAWRTFVWNSEAVDEAHVHVVIVGFSREDVRPKLLFDGGGTHTSAQLQAPSSNSEAHGAAQDWPLPSGNEKQRVAQDQPLPSGNEKQTVAQDQLLLGGNEKQEVAQSKFMAAGIPAREVENINGYLAAAPDVFVTRRAKPLCDVPEMVAGGKPTDGGYLLLTQEERDELVRQEPASERWIRPFSMGAEFIKGIPRYCLWLVDAKPADLKAMPKVRARVEAVREFRAASKKAATRKKADTPWLFDEVRPPQGESYIAIPKVSSGRRRYVPMDFVTDQMIPGDMLFFISDAGLYEFGVLESQFHNAWVRVVAGRLKSDYRYNNTIVYNNFVWPDPTPEQRAEIEACADAVLKAREEYAPATLADLYNPDDAWLYPHLAQAHAALDTAVERAYGVNFKGNEDRIVAHLFALYAEKAKV